MVAKGVIIATSMQEAHDLRTLAFDRFWLHTSPRSLQGTGLRGCFAKPVLLVYGAVDWRALMVYLDPVFQHQSPRVFRLRDDPYSYN